MKLTVKKLLSALFYGVASFCITTVNKNVLTTFAFPSYQMLGLGQMATTIVLLWLGRLAHVLSFPPLNREVAYRIQPMPVIYLGNMITGLGGTKELSLPVFTALRRISVLMTMIGEKLLLSINASFPVQLSVFFMVGGAVLTAADDLAFSLSGYTLVLINDVFSAANGVIMKKKLISEEMLGAYGLMFYNGLFMIVPATLIAWVSGDVHASARYEHWNDVIFLVQFFMSCVMGFILLYSVMMCTKFNGALTTTVIGCLKNILVTYLGIVIGGDYVYSWLNFIGLNISTIASLVYTYVVFKQKSINIPLTKTNKGDIKSDKVTELADRQKQNGEPNVVELLKTAVESAIQIQVDLKEKNQALFLNDIQVIGVPGLNINSSFIVDVSHEYGHSCQK